MSLVIKTWSDGDSHEAPAIYTRFDCHVGMTYEKQIMQFGGEEKEEPKDKLCVSGGIFSQTFFKWLMAELYQLALHN